MISSRRLLFSCFLLALLCFNLRASAQNETGARAIGPDFPFWFDSTHDVLQISYPIIRDVPPLSISMPWEVLVTYIAADSLLRSATRNEIISRIDSWTSINDTSRTMAKFMYQTVDYNPIVFTQYMEETGFYKFKPKYKTRLLDVRDMLLWHLRKFLPDSLKRPMLSAMLADYVLRVKVIRVDSTFNVLSRQWNRYRAIVEVLDTIKGKVFKQYQPDWNLAPNSQSSEHTYSYMAINFSPWVYVPGYQSNLEPIDYLKGDPEFQGYKRYFLMKTGQEAIVFLMHDGRWVDTTHDYFLLDVIREYSNGALPVINGQVRDINHVWSDQTLMDYEEWKVKYEAIRNKILNKNY